jgi:hypothetical protein
MNHALQTSIMHESETANANVALSNEFIGKFSKTNIETYIENITLMKFTFMTANMDPH